MGLYGILNIVYFAFFGIIFIPVGVGVLRLSKLSESGRWAWLFLVLLMLNESTSIILQYSRIRNHFMLQSDSLIVLWAGAGFFSTLFTRKAHSAPSLHRTGSRPDYGFAGRRGGDGRWSESNQYPYLCVIAFICAGFFFFWVNKNIQFSGI